MKDRQKKKKRSSVLPILLPLLAGVLLMAYPTVSNWWNSYHSSAVISSYEEQLSPLNEVDYQSLFEAADGYNRSYVLPEPEYTLSEERRTAYEAALNLAGDGVMGYVEIPKLKLTLPIYHGTEEKVLQRACGHLEWSSLPTGGESTHCVISGHQGLPSARLFTDLDELKPGDLFYLNILNRVLVYEVDLISVVLPEEAELLKIVPGEDLCTLVTCTPYGINTHRLLVRGHRVETAAPSS